METETPSPALLVSVLTPVWNSGKTLEETLRSVAKQTLSAHLIEIIIVDDASKDPFTCALIDRLSAQNNFEGIALTVLRHETHQSAADARNTAFAKARGAFICCLDSDDLLKPSYLKKTALMLQAHPRAGWIYSDFRLFGTANKEIRVPDFNARALFFSNYCHVTSLTRRELWEDLKGQRMERIAGDMPWFEDWDFWIRGMARGWYGVPLKETLVLYRRSPRTTVTRHGNQLVFSNYLLYRLNIRLFHRIKRAVRNMRRDLFRKNPLSLRLAERMIERLLGHSFRVPTWKILMILLFSPRRIARDTTLHELFPTTLERRFHLHDRVRSLPLHPRFTKSPTKRPTIFFPHYWWHMGGAENILLQWMESAKRIPNIRMVDIVATAAVPGERFLRDDFEKLADEQFALSNMGINAMSHLELCWHLIQLEQPDVIFIMSNPHFYVLSPLIKKHFPTTKIVDLLHCEDNDDPSWFGTSYEYQQYLDKRIVMSDVWANVLREKYHESADRIIVARQGIDVQTFDPARFDRTALRAMYDIDPSAFVIGFLGRFHDQKNPHVMLQVAKVLRDDPRYHIVMVGGGDHEKDIRKEAKFFKNLTVLPATRNPAAMYAMFDVAVFPSVYEGFPLVGLEAAAMNVPVIATDVTGFREQIGEGKFGVLYEQSFDREKDGRVICDLLKRHADEWKDIGGRGRGFVERGYGVEDMMDQCKTVVGGLLG